MTMSWIETRRRIGSACSGTSLSEKRRPARAASNRALEPLEGSNRALEALEASSQAPKALEASNRAVLVH